MRIILKTFLISFTISTTCIASSKELSPAAYTAQAKEFLKKDFVRQIGKESIIKFLNERYSGAQKLIAGTLPEDEKSVEMRYLDARFTKWFLITKHPIFPVIHYYANMTQAYRTHALRKHFGCYTDQGKLADFEQHYEIPLEKVSLEEFQQKIKSSFTKETMDHLLFTTSEKLAQAALNEINTQDLAIE